MSDQDTMIQWVQCRIKATKFDINLWDKQHSKTAAEFIEDPSIASLFVTVDQDSNQLIVCCRAPPVPSDSRSDVTYFIRAQGQILTPQTIEQTIIYGTTMMKQSASSVLQIMEEEFYPNIFHSREEWNQSSKQELLGLYHRFLASLTESANEEGGRTMLYLPFKNDESAYLNISLGDKTRIQQLEAVAIHWIRQIKEVLNSHAHNIALDRQGPMEELRFWEGRSEDLAGISDQLNCSEVRRILSILKEINSKYARPVENLAGALQQGAQEADNSVKFLKLLQEPCKLLSSLRPADIPTIMHKFLNCIRLIHSHSVNYKTQERVSDLIRRVSSEIIRHCSSRISLKEIFYGDLDQAMETLHDCIECGLLWKQLYNRTAVTVNKKKMIANKNAPGESWKLDDASIFAEMDAFGQRCDDLTVVCRGRVQFIQLLGNAFGHSSANAGPTFGLTNGPEVENSMKAIQEAFLVQIDRLHGLDYSVLNARESRWHGDFNLFKLAVKDLDTMLVNTINRALEQIEVIDAAGHILQIVHKLAHRPTIKNCAEKKSIELRALFLQQCQKVRHEFDDFHRKPPLRVNEPSFAGAALWANALCTFIEKGWMSVCKATGPSADYDDNLEATCVDLKSALYSYQEQKYKDWLDTLSDLDPSQLQERLDQPILRKAPDVKTDILRPLVSTFDSEIMSIFIEAHFWDKLHNEEFVTPNEVLGIFHQREVLRIVRGRVMVFVSAYNAFIGHLKGTSMLYLDHLKILDKKLRPGFKKIPWSIRPVVIDKFVQAMLTMVHDYHRNVKLFHAGMDRIQKECEKMARTKLIHIDRNVIYEGQLFESIQEDERMKGKQIIIECHKLIEKEVDTMYQQFRDGSEDVQREWMYHMKKVDKMFLNSLKKCIRSALSIFSQVVDVHKHHGEAQPFFITSAELQNGKVECRPSLVSITNAINSIAKEIVCVAKAVKNLSKKWNESSPNNSFFDIISSDEVVLNKIVHIMNGAAICTRDVHDRMLEWDRYRTLWSMDKKSFLRRYSKSVRQAYHDDIQKFRLQQLSIEAEKASHAITFIQINFTDLRSELCEHALDLQKGLLSLLKEKSEDKINAWYEFISESIRRLNEHIYSIPDLIAMIDGLKNVKEKCDKFEIEYEPMVEAKGIIQKFDEASTQFESLESLSNLRPTFASLLQCMEKSSQVVETSKTMMKEDFQDILKNHKSKKAKFCTKVEHEIMQRSVDNLPEALVLVEGLNGDIKDRHDAEKSLQNGLELFEMDLVGSKSLLKAETLVGTINDTVNLFQKWIKRKKEWMLAPFSKIDCDDITQMLTSMVKSMLSMDRDIRSWSLWTTLRDAINAFKDSIPLVAALINVDMRERHWDAVQVEISKKFSFVREEFTLERAHALGLQHHDAAISDISATASKELTIERSLDDIETRLTDFVIDFTLHHDTPKMCPSEDLFSMLEDDAVTVAAIKASSIGRTFLSRVAFIESSLLQASEFFESFLPVQRQWLYLQNIFMGTGDISTQLPQECERFALVHDQFKDMNIILERERKLRAILENNEISMSSLTKIQAQMDQIHLSLKEYLESKRKGFPRFYFISDDDLLEMIGQASHPHRIQKYIKKCFEGINTLLLQTSDEEVIESIEQQDLGMALVTGGKAKDEENIVFLEPVAVQGSIEEWMQRVLREMRSCMTKGLQECFSDLKVTKQNEWVPKWQGQLLITSGAIAWTQRCERALLFIKEGKDKNSLRSVRKRQMRFNKNLTEMVRKGDIDSKNRSKIVALITTELHNRDVIERMIRAGCQNPEDFMWRSQLRFYLDGSLCSSQQNNHGLPFGYEYQGNNGRLVVTPLTDRCVLTLLTALSFHRGGNPLGPAGTGKTETVKDLSKNLAYFCIVTNCSENMDYKSLGKIFSGLCQSGSWGCFDEFNRIKVEVISVTALQIASLLNAQRCKLDSFPLMGVETPCSPHTGIFITMNPGYAGRTELPDNLKANLRPVAMMAPDLVLIAEVVLAAEGFASGRSLAKKTISLYRLMKQQLSKQSHYDFGLRNIKSVLTMAGSLKRKEPTEDETMIIIRALVSMNTPRFVSRDQELFHLLLIDLFPEKNLAMSPDSSLAMAIKEVLSSKGLTADKSLLSKTIQLADSQMTRHSNMLIGGTMTGKSTIWQSLSAAKSMLDLDHPSYSPSVKTHTLNPKALSISELYGKYDMGTLEWSDGVLSTIFKTCAEVDDGDSGEHWIIMDGPVDALWIESMNSVMDDSKLLTLINGDRVSMTDSMSLVFEVEDLAVASPATISRAGMIFVSCDFVWKPFIKKWQDSHVDAENSKKEDFMKLCDKYFEPIMAFKSEHCYEAVPLNDLSALTSFTNLFDTLLPTAFDDQLDTASNTLVRWFLFCLVWTIGGAVDSDGRMLLDQHLRKLDPKIMPSRCIYDYFIDPNTNDFQLWSGRVSKTSATIGDSCYDIVVPTIDTTRNSFIVDSLCNGGYRVLITGSRGTGKTLIAQSYLQKQPEQSRHITINLSRTTTSNSLQSLIEASLEKRSKGVIGPPISANKLVIFIDDLNMPKKTSEESPFQPPLELLRQFIDYGGWYERSKCSWEKVVDTHLLCAMSHPTGGREVISSRTQSRFTVLNCTEYDTKQTALIFHSILRCKLLSFPDNITELFNEVSKATIAVYNEVRSTFRPIPGKSHYIFDLRDILRVAYGMCLIEPDCNNHTKGGFLDLWVHECMRTFGDRLVHDSSKDEDRFWKILMEYKRKYFSAIPHENIDMATHEGRLPPTFSHIVLDDTNNGVSPCYKMVQKMPLLQKHLTQYLEDYNGGGNFISMNLVLFHDAMNHVCRVQRILHLDRGNMLFVGVGGSGRESLTRLAAFITGYTFFRIEATQKYRRREFLEDLKALLIKCGVGNTKVLFFLKDADIKEEIFLEDLSSLLVSGSINGAFAKEDIIAICDGVRKDALASGVGETEDMLWKYFLERVRKNLRIVVALSSIGPTFLSRIQSYPALVNCAIINWFNPWPKSALEQIANKQVVDVRDQDMKLPANLPKCMANMHFTSGIKSNDMKCAVKRYNYVTPTNFLELLKTFKTFYRLKGDELNTQTEKLSRGLYKLQAGRNQVAAMRIQLEQKQQTVVESQQNCETMMAQIVMDKKHTEQQKRAVGIESNKIANEEKQCLRIAAEAEADLTVALPALQNALDQVEKLDKSSITELKAYANPPAAVEQVLSCVMILLEKPTGWTNAKKVMGHTNFLTNLKSYDKDDVNRKILSKVGKFVNLPSFASAEITKVSKAAGALCAWCHAIYMYAGVAKEVAPKRSRLKAAEASLSQKQNDLKNAKDALSAATSKLLNLKQRYDDSVTEKNTLAQEATILQQKLERAEKLVNGLSLEYNRWKASIHELEARTKSLLGDALVSSAILSYGGPFDTSFRSELLLDWTSQLKNEGIHISSDFSLENCLGNCRDIQTWNVQGLPKDSFSTDNALIINNSNRWPLIIDPQGQAKRWITASLGKSLKVLDMKKKEYLRELETAISFGLPVLIHNVLENLDSNLDPVLSRSLIKRGNRFFLRLGDKEIDYNDNFRLFITTKLSNPHYSPEILAKITLVNFAVTRLGLEEQLLALTVIEEAPILETKKREVTVKLSDGRNRLLELEDDILRLLVESTGNLIDDLALIQALQESKNTAETVNSQILMVEETATKIDLARNVYRNAATRASTVFFSLSDMSSVDPMYQFSLDTYMTDFKSNIDKSREMSVNKNEPSAEDRVIAITNYHTVEVFKSTCIALFEKDKLLFAVQLCCSIMLEQGTVKSSELDFICHGTIANKENLERRTHDFSWMNESSNKSLLDLNLVIEGIVEGIAQDEQEWKKWYESDTPETIELPGSWSTQLSDIQQLCILRGLRLDRMLQGATILIEKRMGKEFTESHSFDLEKAYEKSLPDKPLLIILSPGVDPISQISNLAKSHSRSLVQVALGQGQGPSAIKAIEKASESGAWVFLANCHLMPNWMADLESTLDSLAGRIHSSFRLWLSSKPTSDFPLTILQQSVKVTTEPPKGLSSNLLQMCNLVSSEEFDVNAAKPGYNRLFFCLSWIHSILIERRKFKSQGFNIQYDFNESDFTICHDILAAFLGDNKDNIPFEALQYLIGEANYGGRVTDEWDRRVLNVYIKSLLCKEAVDEDNFALAESPDYFIPSDGTLSSYKTYARSLRFDDDPTAFGQHSNAQISSQVEDAKRLLHCISLIRHDKQFTAQSSGDNNGNHIIVKLERIPKCLDPKKVSTYENHTQDPNALQTFLNQEIQQYDELLSIIHKTREDLAAALDGQISMNANLQCILQTLTEFKVPKQWLTYYHSCKPLDSWIEDLCRRIKQLESWIENDAPNVFWLGGFTFPSGFLTAIVQIEARKKGLPIDSFGWNFVIIDAPDIESLGAPDEGVYISGLFLEGARYDIASDCLSDPLPMELIHKMPVIHFHPSESAKKPNEHKYICPLYTCPDRAGPSQSPSYVFPLHLNIGSKSSDHWVKRGVAMLLSTAD